MKTPRDPRESALYQAAIAQERAERQKVDDNQLGAVERVMAYARWLKAVERVKALSSGWTDAAPPPAE